MVIVVIPVIGDLIINSFHYAAEFKLQKLFGIHDDIGAILGNYIYVIYS